MAQSLPTVIVWEFQSDLPGMFTPYSDKVSNHIEDQFNQDPTSQVMLGSVEPMLKNYTVEFGKMIQTSSKNASQRQVRRKLYDTSSTIGNGIVWEWLTDLGWITYDVETLNAIEGAFTRNEDELDLAQLQYHLPNVVLIQKGYQKNKNTNFIRPIQRRAVTYKSASAQNVLQPVRKRANQVVGTPIPMLYQNVAVNPLPNNPPANNPPARKVPTQTNGGAYSGVNKPMQRKSRNAGLPQRTPGAVGGPISPVKPPAPKRSVEVMKYCDQTTQVADGEECAICLIPLKDSDDEGDDDDNDDDNNDDKKLMDVDPIVQLKKCKHSYHQSCMEAYCKQGLQNGCIQCPVCKTIHGVKYGSQPPGKMDISIDKHQSVAGYEGDGMITIKYNMHSGMQGPNDPNPGTRYNAIGFPRIAYLPANPKGMKVLKLLKLAWERKLIFTVATSTTTGRDNCVVWNEIHHKTSPSDAGTGHGFPDPTYLDNVIDELKQHGVVEDDVP